MSFAKLPAPPYYAVIFCSTRPPESYPASDGYGDMAERMAELAATMPGYLGRESARSGDGFGITVSYWDSEASIAGWKSQIDHKAARDHGRAHWYQHYELRIARVERAYGKPVATA